MSKLNECLNFLAEMAFRLGIQEDTDKRRLHSYEHAYESLKNAASLDGYQKLPSIGPSISASLAEVIKTGKSSKLNELRKLKGAPPVSIMELLKIRGVGPKTALKLWREAGISSMAALEKAITEHRINDVKLIDAYYKATNAMDRFSRAEAVSFIEPMMQFILDLERISVRDVQCTGSYRRLRPDVRDFDVLVTLGDLSDASKVVKAIERQFKFKVTLDGGRKANLDVPIGDTTRNLEITFCSEEEHGCALVHFTGSKDFNVALRTIANKRQFTLNQECIQDQTTGKKRYFKTEEEVFKFFKLPYVPPECRDAYLFAEPMLPSIIEVDDVVADLHVHTKDSDGQMTITEAFASAKQLGYKALGISDHSQGSGNGVRQEPAIARSMKLRERRVISGVRIVSGVELDVRVNGQLDYDVAQLSKFNYVILALHAQPDLNVESRLSTAIAEIRQVHPNLPLIWAHPTGRLLGSRAEADMDWGRAFRTCSANKVAIEINGQPLRLDLSDSKCRVAKRIGCKFIVSTDSHGKQLSSIQSAVDVARRALLTRNDVINASTSGLIAWLKGGY